MNKALASYIDMAIATIICLAITALLSYTSLYYEDIIINSAKIQFGISSAQQTENTPVEENFELHMQPIAASCYLSHVNTVPSAHSFTKLSKIISSVNSVLSHKATQTNTLIADYHMTDIISVCHRPAIYYIFALNRMRD